MKEYTSLDSFTTTRGECFVVKANSKEDLLGQRMVIDNKTYGCIGIENFTTRQLFAILTKEIDESK